MYLLDPDTSHRWLPLVEPLLHKAYEKTNIGSFVTKENLRSNLSSGYYNCFVSSDAKYAGVFTVTDKSIHFWLSGGEEPIGGWKAVDDFLVLQAHLFDKKYIQLEGRLGWRRKVEPLGYQVDSLIMIKEVTNESL